MAPRKMTTAKHTPHKRPRSSASSASPIQVSTPPVVIVGSSRRRKGGFRLDG
jgi:hypothetical protein